MAKISYISCLTLYGVMTVFALYGCASVATTCQWCFTIDVDHVVARSLSGGQDQYLLDLEIITKFQTLRYFQSVHIYWLLHFVEWLLERYCQF